jgi:hypothetical protein
MGTYEEAEVLLHALLTLALDDEVSFTPQQLQTLRKSRRHPLDSRALLDVVAKTEIHFSSGSQTPVVHLAPSHYTDWAVSLFYSAY